MVLGTLWYSGVCPNKLYGWTDTLVALLPKLSYAGQSRAKALVSDVRSAFNDIAQAEQKVHEAAQASAQQRLAEENKQLKRQLESINSQLCGLHEIILECQTDVQQSTSQ
jgi:hypothetical protein